MNDVKFNPSRRDHLQLIDPDELSLRLSEGIKAVNRAIKETESDQREFLRRMLESWWPPTRWAARCNYDGSEFALMRMRSIRLSLTVLSDCTINKFSSRVCERGTKCCVTCHAWLDLKYLSSDGENPTQADLNAMKAIERCLDDEVECLASFACRCRDCRSVKVKFNFIGEGLPLPLDYDEEEDECDGSILCPCDDCCDVFADRAPLSDEDRAEMIRDSEEHGKDVPF